ncbi:hypothetical protein [Bacillus infantis]|uniref:hypothetical protein n=1 Tax=Bacillus infantis TaxID=324767 RepID=UPI0016535E73|nr:hypothetical protein [Bacillus infantis]
MEEWRKLIEDIKDQYSPEEVRRILYVYSAYQIIDKESQGVFANLYNESKVELKN